MTSKISIAMCSYNGAKYLQEQLDSIARQSRLPNELVVCDDNSSDQSLYILERFSSSAPFPVRLFKNQTNMGSTRNFEKALTLCEGDIIALSDQDDTWHDDKLERLEEVFNSSMQVGVVFANGNIVDEDLICLGYTLWDTYNFKNKDKQKMQRGESFDILLNHNVITGATMAFRSSFRNKITPIAPLWVHDAWIALVLSIYCKIEFIDKPLIEYRQHSEQQIGGLEKDLGAKIAISRSVTDYDGQIRQFEMLLEHFRKQGSKQSEYHAVKIIDKIEHLRARANVNGCNLLVKTMRCTGELLRGKYHRYSNGYLSYIKDIVV